MILQGENYGSYLTVKENQMDFRFLGSAGPYRSLTINGKKNGVKVPLAYFGIETDTEGLVYPYEVIETYTSKTESMNDQEATYYPCMKFKDIPGTAIYKELKRKDWYGEENIVDIEQTSKYDTPPEEYPSTTECEIRKPGTELPDKHFLCRGYLVKEGNMFDRTLGCFKLDSISALFVKTFCYEAPTSDKDILRQEAVDITSWTQYDINNFIASSTVCSGITELYDWRPKEPPAEPIITASSEEECSRLLDPGCEG